MHLVFIGSLKSIIGIMVLSRFATCDGPSGYPNRGPSTIGRTTALKLANAADTLSGSVSLVIAVFNLETAENIF